MCCVVRAERPAERFDEGELRLSHFNFGESGVGFFAGVSATIREADAEQYQRTTQEQRRCELFAEQPRGEDGGERALREERHGCDRGGEMA